MFTDLLWATAWAQSEGAASHPSIFEQLFPIIAAIFFVYLLFMRPAQKKAQTHKDFVTTLKRGDSVLTSGGILGTIEGLTDQFVILQIAEDVKVRILRTQIASSAGQELKKND